MPAVAPATRGHDAVDPRLLGATDPPAPAVTGSSGSARFADGSLANLSVVLIAPDVSEQLGGEAMKALHILRELRRLGVDVHQVTHDRRRAELERIELGVSYAYVPDTAVQRFLWRSVVLRWVLSIHFMYYAARLARQIVGRLKKEHPDRRIVIHYTSPVSPVLPCFRTPEATTVIGPLNGNIHYPPAFRAREGLSYRLRRLLLTPAQLLHRTFFRGKQSAQALLVAGGARTADSLLIAGCRPEQFVASIDSGILERLKELPRIEHAGINRRFVHNGRLVKHKGVDLAIRAVAQSRAPVELDIIGRGPVEDELKALTQELGVTDRVHFLGWIEDHAQLPSLLRQYRGYVFPSLAEANGIVVQEAMLLGLPVICLNWGGPALLVTPECGILVEPRSEEEVVRALATAMDRLSTEWELADRMSRSGRERAVAEGYAWSDCIEVWVGVYLRALQAHPRTPAPGTVGG